MGYRNIKKQKNLFLFFKLRIFIFQCPGTTHITNFTKMPHMLVRCLPCTYTSWKWKIRSSQHCESIRPFSKSQLIQSAIGSLARKRDYKREVSVVRQGTGVKFLLISVNSAYGNVQILLVRPLLLCNARPIIGGWGAREFLSGIFHPT